MEHWRRSYVPMPCSGAFFILDATVNTEAESADTSRMGVYLRFSDLKAVGTANQHMVYFRGAADIARKKQIQMHNRWNLEFDTSLIPCYETLLEFRQSRLAEGAMWTERIQLSDTWEDVILLCVPVLDQNGVPWRICGVELSQLYFVLSYPAAESRFGKYDYTPCPGRGQKIRLVEIHDRQCGRNLPETGWSFESQKWEILSDSHHRNGSLFWLFQSAGCTIMQRPAAYDFNFAVGGELSSGISSEPPDLVCRNLRVSDSDPSHGGRCIGTFFSSDCAKPEGCAADKDGRRWPECQDPFRHLRD